MRHEPSLDGLRGAAIALVLAAHLTDTDLANTWPLPFGMIHQLGLTGVDLFFVLSGFLITGILIDAPRRRGRAADFALARALRILPAYAAALLFFSVLMPWLFPAGNAFSPSWMREPLWHWTFLSNFYYQALGYFPFEPMTSSWSLAVEAQFYLVWPLLIWRLPATWRVPALATLLLVSPVVRLGMAALGANEMQIYVSTPARLDPFAAGALVAVAHRDARLAALLAVWWRQALLAAALVVLAAVALMLAAPNAVPFLMSVSYSGVAIFFGALLAGILTPAPPQRLTRLLRSAPLRRLGTYSYGIFLTNLAVCYGLRLLGTDALGVLGPWGGQIVFYPLGLGPCVAVGMGVYHGFEAPFLRLKRALRGDRPGGFSFGSGRVPLVTRTNPQPDRTRDVR